MTDLLQNPQRAVEPTTTSDEESPANRATCHTGPRLWCRTRDPGLSFEPSSPSDFEPRFPNGYGERASRGGSLWMRLDPLIILSRTTVYKRWKCILDPFGPTLSRTPPGQLCTRCCPLTVTSFLAETRVNFTVPRASISSLSKCRQAALTISGTAATNATRAEQATTATNQGTKSAGDEAPKANTNKQH